MKRRFQELLNESAKIHGHLCPGQVLGIRMAILGLERIGITDPKGKDRKKLFLFVEIDRCATDALQSVTGCSLGRRTMKFLDCGKMAATFFNLETNLALRVVTKEEARQKARNCFPDLQDLYVAQLEAYKIMPESDLFRCSEVLVDISPQDMPGKPMSRVECEKCGEWVQDRREVVRGGQVLCRPCAGVIDLPWRAFPSRCCTNRS